MDIKEKYILGIKINHRLTYSKVVSLIGDRLEKKQSSLICTTNPEFILKARKDDEFRKIINSSFLSLPDGFGVLLALEYLDKTSRTSKKIYDLIYNFILGIYVGFKSFLKGSSYGNTITGIDLIYKLCSYAEKNSHTVYLLGGWPKDYLGRSLKNPREELSKLAGERLTEIYPKLRIVGSTSRFSSHISDDKRTISFIKKDMQAKGVDSIDIILVAYAFGEQEKWLQRNMSKLDATIGIGVGGSFDYISNYVKRPPKFVTNCHLEWLYRLLIHPFRIKRILNASIVFPWQVFISIKNVDK